jgi:hypothetical protein
VTVPEKSLISGFEKVLDAELARCRLLKFDPSRTIEDIAGMISMAFSTVDPAKAAVGLGNMLCNAYDVMLPFLMQMDSGMPSYPGESIIMHGVEFMSHYHALREYLYYTYTAPGAFDWEFEQNVVRIKFRDRSIPRQFAHMWNSQIMGLLPIHQFGGERTQRIHELLRDADEVGDGDHIQETFTLVMAEAGERVRMKFDLLGGENSTVAFQEYDYVEFYRVYKYLLAKMLHHRYYAQANSTWATFIYPSGQLLQEIAMATDMDTLTVGKVMADLTYSRNSGRMFPEYFPAVKHHMSESYIIVPELLISADGLAQLLKVQAARSPTWFTSNVGGILGRNFVENLGSRIESVGFNVIKNIQLRKFDPSAPDIDLLVISKEATFGYVAFAIEAKGTIPGFWAKDYLRVLGQDSVRKAYDQTRKILLLLQRSEVHDYLVNLIMKTDPNPLPGGLMLIHVLIVTSQNAGMFFDDADIQAIDYRTILQIFDNCDGDVVYVLDVLRKLREGVDFEVVSTAVRVGDREVSYEEVKIGEPFILEKNRWKSGNVDQVVAEEFFAEGGELFDFRKHVSFKEGRPVRREDG